MATVGFKGLTRQIWSGNIKQMHTVHCADPNILCFSVKFLKYSLKAKWSPAKWSPKDLQLVFSYEIRTCDKRRNVTRAVVNKTNMICVTTLADHTKSSNFTAYGKSHLKGVIKVLQNCKNAVTFSDFLHLPWHFADYSRIAWFSTFPEKYKSRIYSVIRHIKAQYNGLSQCCWQQCKRCIMAFGDITDGFLDGISICLWVDMLNVRLRASFL